MLRIHQISQESCTHVNLLADSAPQRNQAVFQISVRHILRRVFLPLECQTCHLYVCSYGGAIVEGRTFLTCCKFDFIWINCLPVLHKPSYVCILCDVHKTVVHTAHILKNTNLQFTSRNSYIRHTILTSYSEVIFQHSSYWSTCTSSHFDFHFSCTHGGLEAPFEVSLFLAVRYFGSCAVFLKATAKVSWSAQLITCIWKLKHCQRKDKDWGRWQKFRISFLTVLASLFPFVIFLISQHWYLVFLIIGMLLEGIVV